MNQRIDAIDETETIKQCNICGKEFTGEGDRCADHAKKNRDMEDEEF